MKRRIAQADHCTRCLKKAGDCCHSEDADVHMKSKMPDRREPATADRHSTVHPPEL